MKQYFNVTLALEIDTIKQIENLDELNISLNDLTFNCQNAHVKVIDVPESYEVIA